MNEEIIGNIIIIILGLAMGALILAALASPIIVIIVTIILIRKKHTKRLTRGEIGEQNIYFLLSRIINPENILRNLYLPKESGKYTEIDLVAVTKKGIIVVESKNYSGWIFGSEHQRNWTQTFRNGEKFKLYNPIWQNEGHIREIKRNLKHSFPLLPCFNFVVFSNNCEFKTEELKNFHSENNTYVIQANSLINVITSHLFSRFDVFGDDEVTTIVTKLEQFSNVKEEIKNQHIVNVQNNKYEFNKNIPQYPKNN